MPTYEYHCQKCDHRFELVQPMIDKTLTICPKEKCGMKKWGKGRVKKMISGGGGLIFKGSGFYITDYRSDKYKEAARKESGTSTASDAKPAAGTSESKPKKAETKPAAKSSGKD